MKRRLALKLALSGVVLGLSGCANSLNGENGWTQLLNGKNVDDWLKSGGIANWRVEDGVLIADILTAKDPSYLVTKESYADFQLKAEFYVDSNTNSGIFIRCEDPAKVSAKTAYEVNIWDTRADKSYGTGAIVDVAKVSPMPLAGGKWNTFDITAKGKELTVVMNGVKVSSGTDAAHTTGRIALQFGGGGVVKFRSVSIRKI